MMAGAQDLDVEEGLEEAIDSLSLDHVTRVSSHVTPATPRDLLSHLKEPAQLPHVFRNQKLSTKVANRGHVTVM